MDDVGVYQAVLKSTNSTRNHFVEFEIRVEEFQNSNDDYPSPPTVEPQNENYFTAAICLGLYGAILSFIWMMVSWKYFKIRNSVNKGLLFQI